MHSFLSYPPSYLTAESEPFSSVRVRPPLHPSDTLTIYAVISVLPSVLPHCIVWYGFRLIVFSPCDHLCSAPDPHRVTSPLHPPPPLTSHAVTCAPYRTTGHCIRSSPQFYSRTGVCDRIRVLGLDRPRCLTNIGVSSVLHSL